MPQKVILAARAFFLGVVSARYAASTGQMSPPVQFRFCCLARCLIFAHHPAEKAQVTRGFLGVGLMVASIGTRLYKLRRKMQIARWRGVRSSAGQREQFTGKGVGLMQLREPRRQREHQTRRAEASRGLYSPTQLRQTRASGETSHSRAKLRNSGFDAWRCLRSCARTPAEARSSTQCVRHC